MLRSRFLAGALASFGPAIPAARPRGVLRVAAAPIGHDIDPYRDAQPGVDELAWLYADGLVAGERGEIPLLAQRLPEIDRDGLRYRYRLRKAVWHDGRPLSARDVATAFDQVRASPWGDREPYRSVSVVVVLDDLNLEVRLNAPLASFGRTFFGAYGSPALPLIRHDGGPFPLGTGPFAVQARPDAGRWLLKAWAGSPRGTCASERIDLRLLTADLTANVQLLSGEADIALPLPPNTLGSERFRRVTRFTSTAVLIMNAEGLLRTTAARKAFAAVADVPALQRAYDRRRSTLLASLMLSGPNDASLAAELRYRPDEAPALRAAVGGRELVLAYIGGSASHERTMLLLQQILRGAGVACALRPYPRSLYLGLEGPLRTGRYDVALDGLVYADGADIASDWSCRRGSPVPGNFARWCDPAFGTALTARRSEAALRRLYDSLPCVPLSRAYEQVGFLPAVRGLQAPPPLVPATYGCNAWAITEAASRR